MKPENDQQIRERLLAFAEEAFEIYGTLDERANQYRRLNAHIKHFVKMNHVTEEQYREFTLTDAEEMMLTTIALAEERAKTACKLSHAQAMECAAAIADVMRTGKTQRTCPLCGGRLQVTISGESGDVRCEASDCFGSMVLRGV